MAPSTRSSGGKQTQSSLSSKDALEVLLQSKFNKFMEETEGLLTLKKMDDDGYLPKANLREFMNKLTNFTGKVWELEKAADISTRECSVCYKKPEICRISWANARMVACCERVCVDCIHKIYNRRFIVDPKCPHCQTKLPNKCKCAGNEGDCPRTHVCGYTSDGDGESD